MFEILLKELNGQVFESESLSKKTGELKNLYFLFSENCIKSKSNLSELVHEFENKLISHNDLEMETRKCSELQIYAEEKKQEFEQSVSLINMTWKKQFTNFTQFMQTMNNVDRDRQMILVSIKEGIKSMFEIMTKSVSNQRNSMRKSIEKTQEELQKISFQNLQTKVEKLARMNLNLAGISNITFEFVSYESFISSHPENRRSSIVVSPFDLTMSKKEQEFLNELINDVFSSQIVPAKAKISDSEIKQLFAKEDAVLEFLMRAQKILSTENFEYLMNETKYAILKKIMRAIINRLIKRNSNKQFKQGRKV